MEISRQGQDEAGEILGGGLPQGESTVEAPVHRDPPAERGGSSAGGDHHGSGDREIPAGISSNAIEEYQGNSTVTKYCHSMGRNISATASANQGLNVDR